MMIKMTVTSPFLMTIMITSLKPKATKWLEQRWIVER